MGLFCPLLALLPSMIKRRQGHIVAISSVQGKISIPFRSACKYLHRRWERHIWGTRLNKYLASASTFSSPWNWLCAGKAELCITLNGVTNH